MMMRLDWEGGGLVQHEPHGGGEKKHNVEHGVRVTGQCVILEPHGKRCIWKKDRCQMIDGQITYPPPPTKKHKQIRFTRLT